MNGMLVFFAAFSAAGYLFVRHLPDSGESVALKEGRADYSVAVKRVSLLAILLYNIAIALFGLTCSW